MTATPSNNSHDETPQPKVETNDKGTVKNDTASEESQNHNNSGPAKTSEGRAMRSGNVARR